jgi:glutamyl-tRNA reductase
LATGKRVRSQTGIGERNLSLPGVAVGLARDLLGSLEGRSVVIVGTGETSELTARALSDSGAEPVFVASRRRDRAISLAKRYGGSSVSFDELPLALQAADIVVAATASPHLLLEEEELAEVMQAREQTPLLLIDLAVPRDIDAACGQLENVSLYDIDDLESVIARNRKVRLAEARKAEGIIEEEIQQFAVWLGSLEVLPTLAALRRQATEIAEQVVHENEGKWETASPRDRERVQAIARAIVNRVLHEPTVRLKELHDDRVHARMAFLRDLFDLPAEEVAAQEIEPPARAEPGTVGEARGQLAEVRELRRR